jgi:biopolymer transport protein ExbB
MSTTESRQRIFWSAVLATGLAAALLGDRVWAQEATVQVNPPAVAAPAAKAGPLAKEGPIPTTNFFNMMHEGGVLMWPLAFCSCVCLAFMLERIVGLRRSRVIPKAFSTRLLQQLREGTLDREQGLKICRENGSPVAEVFEGALRKWGRPAVEVEQGVIDAGERATNGLRRYLRIFTALAVVAPLLGLLGTVFGMIQAFNAVATTDALGRPELLAKGISQALLNTAFGLTIAIPAQSFYFYLVARIDRLIIDMDRLAQEVVNLISAEELQHRDEVRPKPRRAGSREAV